jgi:Mannosyltransferase (PIG-V)
MNLDTAEPTIAERPAERAVAERVAARRPGWAALPARGVSVRAPRRPAWARGWARADPGRAAAMRDVWLVLWSSRLIVWLAAMSAVIAFGFGPARNAFHPPGVTRGFGWLGDLLAAPAARWDAAWYLVIAHYGYRPDLGAFTASRDAFFPLYPLGVRGLAGVGLPLVLAGVLSSLAALAVALYGLHRLTTIEYSRPVARLTVALTALGPMAFFFSAAYSESLYLALSVGVFLLARQGRWGPAAVLAALAGAARSTGLALAVPLALLYLYGPRADRMPDRLTTGGLAPLAPRYRLRRDALWLGLAPAGLGLYMAYLGWGGGDWLSPFHAQAEWHRHFAGPYLGIWDGAKAAFAGARQLLSLQRTHVYFPQAGGSPFINAGHNLMLFGFLLAALPLTVGVLRRMPLAYGAYVLAALALPLSYPVGFQPLMSLPRFLAVLFPLNMWLADRLHARAGRRAQAVVLACSTVALGFFAAEFATWHWVA